VSCARATYRINQQAELERRRLAAAQARYERSLALLARLEKRIARMRQVYDDLNIDVPAATTVRAGATADAYDAAASATAAAIGDAHRRHEAAVARARARHVATPTFALRAVGLRPAVSPAKARHAKAPEATAAPPPVAPAPPPPPPPPPPSSGPSEDERRGAVERQMARLPGAADAGEVERAEGVANEVLTAGDEVSFRRAVDRLRMAVAATTEHHKAIDARSREIEGLRAGLDGLTGAEVDRARQCLDATDPAVVLPADLAELAAEVEATAARARAERDRSFALDAVAETLIDLGYEVGDDFDEAAARAGGAVVALPGARSEDHAVRVAAGPADLRFELLRYEDAAGDRARDRAVEETWCRDQERLVDGVADLGMDLTFGPPEEPHDLNMIERGQRRAQRDKRRKGNARERTRKKSRT